MSTVTAKASHSKDNNKRKRASNHRRHANNKNHNKVNNPKRGNPGILLSCEPGKELKCRREGLDILLHYYNDLQHKEEDQLSLEDELSMLRKMNENKKQQEDNLPFTVYDTGCRGMVFLMYNPKQVVEKGAKKVKMSVEEQADNPIHPSYNPMPILESIQEDILTQSNKSPSSRFILRMVPIQITCFASIDEIQTAAKTVIGLYLLPNLPKSSSSPSHKKQVTNFEIQFQKRICSNVTREEVISTVADLLLQNDDNEFKVNLSDPEYTIMIQICKTLCGISVIKNYSRFMKFNLFTLRSSVGASDLNNDPPV